MSGKRVTDRQVRRYMDSRKDGHIQVAAAARAGFSERTGRRIDGSPVLPSQRDRTRRYRTRQDPFAEVWRAELVPMLTAIADAAPMLAKDDDVGFMNKVALLTKPPAKKEKPQKKDEIAGRSE